MPLKKTRVLNYVWDSSGRPKLGKDYPRSYVDSGLSRFQDRIWHLYKSISARARTRAREELLIPKFTILSLHSTKIRQLLLSIGYTIRGVFVLIGGGSMCCQWPYDLCMTIPGVLLKPQTCGRTGMNLNYDKQTSLSSKMYVHSSSYGKPWRKSQGEH